MISFGSVSAGAIFSFLLFHPYAASATPAFVQQSATKTTQGSTVSASFSASTTAGNLIVAFVVWDNDGPVSLTDSAGNTYTNATASAKYGRDSTRSQVFYAANIKGGADTVTVTFLTSVSSFGLIYVNEYSGIDLSAPLEATASATGSSLEMSAGPLTTTSVNDILFAGAASNSVITGGDPGFATRCSFDGNLTMDRLLAPGSYSVTATQNGSAWVMQLAAFRGAAGIPSNDAQPPTVPTSLSAVAVSSTKIALSWAGSADNVGVAGYRVFRDGAAVGTTSATTYSDAGLRASTTYTYTVSAFDAVNNASAQSASASATTQQASSGLSFPAGPSPNGRYLLDQNGKPFLMFGDSAHALIPRVSLADADTYLASRHAAGVNVLWLELFCSTYIHCPGYTSYDGVAPFKWNGSNPDTFDLASPNEAYFSKVDTIISLAASYGITALLDPTETGGWLSVFQANGATKAYNFGVYLGNRYKNYHNIIWLHGNDFQTWKTSSDDNLISSVAKGIQSVDPNRMQTVELDYPTSASLDDHTWAPLIQLDSAYSYYSPYDQVLREYNRPQFIPVYFLEGVYEYQGYMGGYSGPHELRAQEYWTQLSGSTGQLYGNADLFPFPSGWQTSDWNTSVGFTQSTYWYSFFQGINWYDLVPDQNHSVVTSGYKTYQSVTAAVMGNTSDYATTARASDGSVIVCYMPTSRSITVDMTKLSGSASAYWFDPTNGSYTPIAGSPFANSGSLTFSPAHSNSASDGDWVLLLRVTGAANDTQAPTTPAGLVATSISASRINLTWNAATDNVGVAGYRIYRNAIQIATTADTSYSDDGLSPSTTYTYAVSAFDAAGNVSAASSTAQATTAPGAGTDTQAPTIPMGLTARAVSHSQVSLTWNASTDNVGVAGYRVYRNAIQIATTADTSYSDDGLSASTTYTYAVSAFDAAGNVSAASSTAQATTAPGTGTDTQAPTIPMGLRARAVSHSRVDLTWSESTDNIGVAGYRIYRNAIQIATTADTSYSDDGLSPSTTYTYAVSAFDAAGNVSAASSTAQATTAAPGTGTDTQAPTIPMGLTARAVSHSRVSLTWNASTDNVGVAGYRIYRNGAHIASTANTSYSDSGLSAFTAYAYAISAFDAAGNASATSSSIPPIRLRPQRDNIGATLRERE